MIGCTSQSPDLMYSNSEIFINVSADIMLKCTVLWIPHTNIYSVPSFIIFLRFSV